MSTGPAHRLEDPDEEQDQENQDQKAPTDVHPLALLSHSLEAAVDSPMYPAPAGLTPAMRARGLEPLRTLRPNGT
jgi:hypothetical protein